MGDDWKVEVLLDSNIYDLKVYIEENRGISRHRIMVRDSKANELISLKREKNTFRRLLIPENYVFIIEPTLIGSWLWNPYDWYE